MDILVTDKLSKTYDGQYFALSNCTFSLQKGQICAVVGESGSGKSTLLRLIAGLERPDGGTITIEKEIMSDDTTVVAPQKRNVGLVFQDFALFPHMTVEQNIAFGLKADKAATVKRMLAVIKMEAFAKRYPSELSGGQEQRVALARTLAINPRILLLDEPFSNLDTSLKAELRQEIRDIAKDFGTTLVFITHDIFDAIDIADQLIILKAGKIIRHCKITDFAKDVTNEDVKTMLVELKENAERMLSVLD
ncbi:MAG: ABC transporter ATP-binding protein [Bacteroidota bacterium]